jgi:hypothetical protein
MSLVYRHYRRGKVGRNISSHSILLLYTRYIRLFMRTQGASCNVYNLENKPNNQGVKNSVLNSVKQTREPIKISDLLYQGVVMVFILFL